MKSRSVFIAMPILALAMIAQLVLAGASHAQGTNPNKVVDQEAQQDQNQQIKERTLQNGDQQTPAPAAPKVDPAEEADYKAFFETGASAPDTRIQLGNDFLTKYPMSRYDESVYSGVIQAYYAKQDWKDFYATADKGIAAYPDDVTMLAIVGWVIPHVFDPTGADASADLDKAEKYEKHAIEVTGTMPKPPALTDEQFAQSKATVLSEAHSGLGLVYFRRGRWADSATELQQATQASASPDQTDFYVTGLDFDKQSKYPEAVEAYTKCGQAMGSLQDRCKQSAEADKKQAAQPK
jgi:tetratricopeptide (TPR) repeat protein